MQRDCPEYLAIPKGNTLIALAFFFWNALCYILQIENVLYGKAP
jgi:hypothetical protein